MNALEQARSAYAPTAPIRSPRATEYQAFARITEKLRALSKPGTPFAALVEALSDNRRLWSILAVDVADDDNSLPQTVRAQIFYLAEFTNHHTRLVLKGEADAAPLVEINAAIMRGLRAQATP